MKLFRILDPFTLTLITVVLLASFFPARGEFVPFVEHLTTAAIALLFFMHGAKLSREAIIAGGSHWRLHLWVMCSTFIVFPVLGVLFAWWAPIKVDPMLYSGFIYLCILPATVQSAIAFTSLAGGNVAAAVCSASASSLLGIFVSPLLVGLLMHLHGAGGDQHRQAMGGDGNQRRQHKNRHPDEDHRAAAHAVRERAVEQLRNAVRQEVGRHYALYCPFTDVKRYRHVGDSRNINGLRHLANGHQQYQHQQQIEVLMPFHVDEYFVSNEK